MTALSLAAVRTGLADSLRNLTGLNVYSFASLVIDPPAAVVGFPESIAFHQTMGSGDTEFRHFTIPVRVYCGLGDAESSQDLLASYLQGPLSIKKAIEADTTLGGACQALVVPSVNQFGMLYTIAGTQYLGADWTTEIYG